MRRAAPQRMALTVVVATVLAVLVLIGAALSGLLERRAGEQLEIAAQAIDRAARQCYALEGAYPPELEYLETHYGLVLDREHYHYYYEQIGANIRPIVEVSAR